MAHELAQWIHALKGKRILLVGDLILDRYVYGDAERVSPEAPVPVLRIIETQEAVGGSANVAACLRALGCEVVCCGIFGEDAHGAKLRTLLTELEVDTSAVLCVSDRPTTTKTRLVGLAQHRHRQQLLRVDEEDTRPLGDTAAKSLTDLARKQVRGCDVICIEDYDKGVINASMVQTVLAEARKHNRPTLVDPARLRDYARYAGASIVTPNRDELSIVEGRTLDTIEDVAAAAKSLIDRHNLDAAVVTLDRDGALLVQRDAEWQHLPTVPRSVYDNTGAGDAVLAMLAGAIAGGADLADAARLANVAGGLEVEKFGCVPISADEILADLRLEDRIHNGKLCSLDELVAELKLRRDRGETVAMTNGCFDVLHAGHVDFLKRSRKEASLLVVALNSDASIRRQGKGGDRPINRFEHRATVIGALECVDYVVGFEESDPSALIERIKPDVLIKGEDWVGKGVVGRELVEAAGGRVVLLPLVEGLSTTTILERIQKGA